MSTSPINLPQQEHATTSSTSTSADFQSPQNEVLTKPMASATVGCNTKFDFRDNFAKCMKGKGVEIGTYKGDFAAKNIEHFEGEYYMVDIAVLPELKKRLNLWHDRPNVHFLEMTSAKASQRFEDASLDWIYIDALHSYNAVMEDMVNWWPKLKPGGMFSGHDFCASKKDRQAHPELPWCGVYQDNPKDHYRAGKEKASQLKSAKAVLDFAREHDLNIQHTWEGRKELSDAGTSRNPSWYVVKEA